MVALTGVRALQRHLFAMSCQVRSDQQLWCKNLPLALSRGVNNMGLTFMLCVHILQALNEFLTQGIRLRRCQPSALDVRTLRAFTSEPEHRMLLYSILSTAFNRTLNSICGTTCVTPIIHATASCTLLYHAGGYTGFTVARDLLRMDLSLAHQDDSDADSVKGDIQAPPALPMTASLTPEQLRKARKHRRKYGLAQPRPNSPKPKLKSSVKTSE